MVDLFRFRKWDLVSKRGIYYLISFLMLAIGLVAMGIYHARTGDFFKLGIDFKGGGLVTYRLDGKLPAGMESQVIKDIRVKLSAEKIENEVQVSPALKDEAGDTIIIRTMLQEGGSREQDEQLTDVLNGQIINTIAPAVTDAVKQYAPNMPTPVEDSREVVTGTVSQELVKNGVAAFLLGSLLIMGWIWVRYNIGGFGLRYSFAGLIALFHDLLTLLGMFGIFALLDLPIVVNSPFIAALLTVLGYSIHDTIVIFDRIRENMRLRKGRTFAETVNISLLETLARSVNTILTVVFTLLALFFFGGPTLRDFVLAMLIGVSIGGYSSIFVASQLLVSWSKKEEKIILPFDAPSPSLVVADVPKPAMAAAGTSAIPSSMPTQASTMAPPPASASTEAVQRARQAGKTSKRRR